jgi:uncharacterized membrane protein YecN with MAPEG domain
MKAQTQRLPLRERYRAFVNLAIIPLGVIIVVRGAMAGLEAWTIIVLGLAFVGLGTIRLRSYWRFAQASRRK